MSTVVDISALRVDKMYTVVYISALRVNPCSTDVDYSRQTLRALVLTVDIKSFLTYFIPIDSLTLPSMYFSSQGRVASISWAGFSSTADLCRITSG